MDLPESYHHRRQIRRQLLGAWKRWRDTKVNPMSVDPPQIVIRTTEERLTEKCRVLLAEITTGKGVCLTVTERPRGRRI